MSLAPALLALSIAAASPGVDDLPIVEAPAPAGSDLLAVLLTGDGGWASLDRALAAELNRAGVAVVGLDSRRYFWKRRPPERAAADVARLAAHYLASWNRTRILLVGFSRGADVLPFLVNRFDAGLRDRLALVAMLGPGTRAGFEVHLQDLLGSGGGDTPVLPEAQRLGGRVMCVHGTEERDSLCPLLDRERVTVVTLTGGHHFDRDYAALATRLLDAARAGAGLGQSASPAR